MPKTCSAPKCTTFIGDSQDFCRRHWAMIPWVHQRSLRIATEARQQSAPGARQRMAKAVMEAADFVANKERASALLATTSNSSHH